MLLPFGKILCPIDFSEPSYVALDLGIQLAEHFGSVLGLIHVVEKPAVITTDISLGYIDMDNIQKEALEASQQKLSDIILHRVPTKIETFAVVSSGDSADCIISAAEDHSVSLIVIATHGLTGWRHLVFGSVAERVVRLATCPTLVVRAPVTQKENVESATTTESIHNG